jgi:two-component system, NarL family, nitrate/nitrite response regulator NarL
MTLIVEKNSFVREGVRLLLEKTIFKPHTHSMEEGDITIDIEPDILILFGRDKLELSAQIGRLRLHFSEAKIVILTDDGDFKLIASAMDAGASAILLTSISAEDLIKALNAVVADNIFVIDSRMWPAGTASEEGWQPDWIDSERANRQNQSLSLREVEILGRILEGDSNKQIARRLDIAEATVKAHMKTVLRKIGVSNRTQAAIWAMNNGISQPVLDESVQVNGAAALSH